MIAKGFCPWTLLGGVAFPRMIGALTSLGLARRNSAPRLLGRGGSGGDANAADTLPLERLPLELAPQPPTDVPTEVSAPLRALLHDEQQLRRLRAWVAVPEEAGAADAAPAALADVEAEAFRSRRAEASDASSRLILELDAAAR